MGRGHNAFLIHPNRLSLLDPGTVQWRVGNELCSHFSSDRVNFSRKHSGIALYIALLFFCDRYVRGNLIVSSSLERTRVECIRGQG
jgi:hypothetical protein